MNDYIVYEIIDDNDNVLYVGCTSDLNRRFKQHTQTHPKHGHGKFYKRIDVKIKEVKRFTEKREARQFETDHKIANNLKPTEYLQQIAHARKGGLASGKISSKIEYTCPYCGRIIKGAAYFKHLKTHKPNEK